MARIKQVLSERRHAAREAQQLVLAAREAAEQSEDATAPAQSQQSFMEEEAPAKSTTAPMST